MHLVVDVEALAAVCRRYGVARLEVFGSSARGTDGPGSDVDLLYTLLPGVHLGWEVVDLAADLEAVIGRPVDLVSRRALHERLRTVIEAEARPLYAAA